MSSSVSSSLSPSFQASGLASGLDTASIIDNLVKIESRSVSSATARQAAFQTQISSIGDLTSKLQALATAAKELGTSGVLGVTQVGTTSGFTATPGSTASAGRYAVQVNFLAAAAKAQSAAFATDAVRGGTLDLSVNGTSYAVTIGDGDSLATVAQSINQLGAPVRASVLTTNGASYLSLTNQDTGFTIGQPASSALTITETTTGTLGQALGLALTQQAANATVTVDGLSFERTSNTMTDVLPGVTLNLSATTTSSSDLVLSTDTTATQTNLQKFVDAYNALMTPVRRHLNVQTTDDTTKTLAGEQSVRQLQSAMQGLVSGVLTTNPLIRTLADVGIKTGNDGTLSIDAERLGKAMTTDAQAVNSLFQTATTGLSDAVKTLSDRFTNSTDGVFTSRTHSLEKQVKNLDTTIANLQLRVDGYRKRLVAQFAAMEKVVSGFKTLADYLTQQTASQSSSSST